MSKDLLISPTGNSNFYISDGKTKRLLGSANITKQDEANQLCLIWGVVSAGVSGGNQVPIEVDTDLVNNIRSV